MTLSKCRLLSLMMSFFDLQGHRGPKGVQVSEAAQARLRHQQDQVGSRFQPERLFRGLRAGSLERLREGCSSPLCVSHINQLPFY